ncbi:MAG: hypothetical protein WD431_02545 [Cyclobacteriaceae bacterium]
MNEHNPIAHLVTKIQQTWMKEVSSNEELALVRWMILPEEARLYEGFVHLESTPHGTIPEVFIVLMCPFVSKGSFAQDLIKAWVEMTEKDQKTKEALNANGNPFVWDTAPFKIEKTVKEEEAKSLFLNLIGSFRKASGIEDTMLNVVLMPYQIADINAYGKWLEEIFSGDFPGHLRMCIFDLKEESYFDPLLEKLNPKYVKTLNPDLDYQGAVQKVMQSGNPSQPGVKLQRYIYQMSQATAAKNLDKLNLLGTSCLKAMRQAREKVLLATAHIAYAGMLFHFKAHQQIQDLLKQGLGITQSGAKEGNVTCQALLVQYHNFLGSSQHLAKQYQPAINSYQKGAEAAIGAGQNMQAVNSFRLAIDLAKKYQPANYPALLEKAFSLREDMNPDEIKLSGFLMLAVTYCDWHKFKGEPKKAVEADQKMTSIFGTSWRCMAEEPVPEEFQPNYA